MYFSLDYWHGCFLDFRSHDDSTLLTFFFLTCNVNLVVFDHSLVLWEVCLKKWTKMWNKVLNCMGETYRTRATEANFEVSHDSSDCIMLFITGVEILKISCNFVPPFLLNFTENCLSLTIVEVWLYDEWNKVGPSELSVAEFITDVLIENIPLPGLSFCLEFCFRKKKYVYIW